MNASRPHARWAAIATAGAWVAFAILGLSGIAKLLDLHAFSEHLNDWTVLPAVARPLIATLVPGLEIFLAGLWAMRACRRGVVAAGACLAMGLLLAATIQWYVRPVPDCGCFGAIAKFIKLESTLPKLIVLNGGMLVMLVTWMFVHRSRVERPAAAQSPLPNRPMVRRGMTLIEMVLVMGIMGVLISMTIPSLMSARNAAYDTASLANLRQHAAVFSSYASDWDDFAPYPVDPEATYNVFRYGPYVLQADYFEATEYWQIALADRYYEGAYASNVFQHPGAHDTIISYRMTSSYLAAPQYWVNSPERDISLWRGVRASDTRYPSQKALLVEFHPDRGIPIGVGTHATTRTGIAMAGVDGHAARSDAVGLVPPLEHGDGVVDQARFSVGVFGMHTSEGALGRDWN